MTLILPGQPLLSKMDSEAVERLGQELRLRIIEMEQEAAPLFRAISTWWKWYEAVPRDKEKNFPFLGASNVVVPTIGITCDALASRSLATITAAAPTYWTGRTENEDNADIATNMARYINWQADGNEFSLPHVLAEVLLETYVIGRAIMALNYRHDLRPVFFGRTPTTGPTNVKRDMVTFHKGPTVEAVPNEHMLWDRRLRIGDAPIVVRKHEWLWIELRDMAKLDPAWDRQAVEDIQKFPGLNEGDAEAVAKAKADLDLRDTDMLTIQPHDVREVWVDWSMLGRTFEVPGEEEWGGQQVPLLAHVHMQTGRVLRLVGMPYMLPFKPFIDFRFRGGRGVAKRLEQIQSIQTTVWNQAIDSRTRANALWSKTTNAKHTRTPLDASKPLLLDTMGEFEPMTVPTTVQQDLPLLVAAQTMAERWMGQSDPVLGRDTRTGGHSAPATSTLALLEQVDVMSAGTDVIIQQELSRLGLGLAILNQQFEDPSDRGRLAKILGADDARSVGQYLFPDEPIPGNYVFTMAALSRNDNPDASMRRAMMTFQAFQNYLNLSGQGAIVLGNPQVPPLVKGVWIHGMVGAGKLMQQFLDAANVDDTEDYILELGKSGAAAFAQFTQAAGGALGAGGPAPPYAAAAGAGGPAGGPLGATAPGGAAGPGYSVPGGAPATPGNGSLLPGQ